MLPINAKGISQITKNVIADKVFKQKTPTNVVRYFCRGSQKQTASHHLWQEL